jgi:hypothetical protein
MNKPWNLVLVLAGIFIAGGVTGTFVTLRFGREWVIRRLPNHMKKLSDRLGLQPAQEGELRPIVQRNMEELSQVRSGCMTATRAIFDRMEHEISEKLTPEQLIKYDQLNKEMRERARKVMPDRNNRPPGPGGPQPGESGKPPGDVSPPPPGKPDRGV